MDYLQSAVESAEGHFSGPTYQLQLVVVEFAVQCCILLHIKAIFFVLAGITQWQKPSLFVSVRTIMRLNSRFVSFERMTIQRIRIIAVLKARSLR